MITKIFKIVFLLFLTCNYTACKTTQQISHDVQFAASDYIFQGDVVQEHKSNLPVVPDADNTYVVKVNTVILASNGHENFEGENITVVADRKKVSILKERTGYIFYTRTWLFGKTLAVIANYADPKTNKTEELKKELLVYQNKGNQVILQERLKRSELVLLGRVSEIKDADIQGNAKESEHSPQWNVAIIEVGEMLKGNVESGRIQVYFSASDDVRWVNAPKLGKDQNEQNAIYLLKKTDDFTGIKNAYLFIDPNDLLPESELENVKRLLKN